MKADLRKTIVRKMKEQELIVKQQRDALLTQYLLESSTYQQARTVAVYLSLLKQLPTDAEIPNLVQELHQAGSSRWQAGFGP